MENNIDIEFNVARELEENRLNAMRKLCKSIRISDATKQQLLIEIYATEKVIDMIDELKNRVKEVIK